MKRRYNCILACILILSTLGFSDCADNDQEESYLIKVTRVISGDTIELEDGRIVRYIGIDAPETTYLDKPAEHYGPEATEYNKELVLNQLIHLEYDVVTKDESGRTLAYVYTEDGTFVNAELVYKGYARVSLNKQKLMKHISSFLEFQDIARANMRGMWSRDKGDKENIADDDEAEIIEEEEEKPPPPPITVYITRTGERYHRASCRWGAEWPGSTRVTLDEAKRRGYTPCLVCEPPR